MASKQELQIIIGIKQLIIWRYYKAPAVSHNFNLDEMMKSFTRSLKLN